MNAQLAEVRMETADPKKRRTLRPHRQSVEAFLLRPFLTVIPGMLDLAAQLIGARIASVYRHHGFGVYVFVDRTTWACHLLPDDHRAVPTWLQERVPALVGYYSAGTRSAFPGSSALHNVPAFDQGRLLADLTEHLDGAPRP